MGRDFFALEGQPGVIDQTGLMKLIATNPTSIESLIYEPSTLVSPSIPFRWNIKNITFRNVSFSRTVIENFEFESCVFERCLFTWAVIKDCRFVLCSFIDSNPHRFELYNVFVDPKSFRSCVKDQSYSNIGVHVYQELLRGSKAQAQVGFTDEAQFWLSRWERRLLLQQLKRRPAGEHWLKVKATIALKWVSDLTTGSGTSLLRLATTSFVLLLLLTQFNWEMSGLFLFQDSHGNNISSYNQVFYLTTIIVTTLGFGDITPASNIGRVFVSMEAMIGFVFLALTSSTIYRRISP